MYWSRCPGVYLVSEGSYPRHIFLASFLRWWLWKGDSRTSRSEHLMSYEVLNMVSCLPSKCPVNLFMVKHKLLRLSWAAQCTSMGTPHSHSQGWSWGCCHSDRRCQQCQGSLSESERQEIEPLNNNRLTLTIDIFHILPITRRILEDWSLFEIFLCFFMAE